MKRGGPLKRTALKRSSALKQGKGLSRTGGPRRKPPAPRTDLQEAKAWWVVVTAGGNGPCAVCGRTKQDGARIQAHHVIRQQVLEREATSRGIDPALWLWDHRVGLSLCEAPCHANHTSAHRRITQRYLRPANLAFAAELDLGHMLQREHPL